MGDIEAGKRYEEKDFNKIIEIKEREAYRVKLLMGMIDQREKTLVFCATQAHALAVRDLINQAKTLDSHGRDPLYCVRVTANDGALGDQYLRDFQDNEKTIPTVLTTSQKLYKRRTGLTHLQALATGTGKLAPGSDRCARSRSRGRQDVMMSNCPASTQVQYVHVQPRSLHCLSRLGFAPRLAPEIGPQPAQHVRYRQ